MTVEPEMCIQMKQKELAKTVMMISSWKNYLVSMVCMKVVQRFNPYSAGIDFSRQNLTSTDVRFWRLKSTPHCKSENISNGRRPII